MTKSTVVIIGAGVAGLMAGRMLHDAGYTVTLIEARDRIGGRVWTDYDLAPYPIELGAEYIHGANVLTWQWIKRYKLKTMEAEDDDSMYMHRNGKIQLFSDEAYEEWEEELWEVAEEWAESGEPEVDLHTLLELDDGDPETARWMNSLFAPDYGADLNQIGNKSFMEATYEDDGTEDGDFRLVDGYARLIERLATDLDIRLNTPVKHIQYAENNVQITTSTDDMIEADRVIVTLPLGVLKAGDVTFDPSLPDDKQTAIQTIGAGKVNKIILGFKEFFWQDNMNALFTTLDSQLWWRPGWGRKNEQPILTSFAGGQAGENQSQMSEAEAIENSLKDLSQVYGRDISKLLSFGKFINWGADPYSKMSYSFNAIGSAGMREILSQPVGKTLYFAGEACNPIRPGTVHGAMETGQHAAEHIISHDAKS